MNIEVVSLIYKSEGFLDFIIDQLKRYCVSNIHNISFRVVANDPINNIEAVIAKKGIRYSIFKNDNPNEYYINRVYRAYNFCVKSSESDYVCLVNSDMGFSNGWIENLSKLLDEKTVPCSRLVESGKMLSGTYGIGKNFGMSFKNYNESGFQSFARSISEPVSKCGGLYMPVLISKDTFIESGGFPEGNIYADGIGTCNGPVTKSGDAYYFYDVLEAKFGIKHVTAFDSIVYHMQCGEMHE